MGGDHHCLILNQKATNRPDLIVIVFIMKLRELLTNICKNYFLGRPLVHPYTIEFQKRGLFHAHIFVILSEHDNIELDEHILNSALLDIEYRLEKQGRSLYDFGGMPAPSMYVVHMINLELFRKNLMSMIKHSLQKRTFLY